jgi:methylmalonyl-CoA mutase N-terminal domain/subunit
MSGLLSGVQLQGTPAYDEQFGIPTKEAVLTAIRVHHVLSRETGMTDTIDPLAGSYFVESLTSDFEEKIMEELKNIDRQGGIVSCIENGYLQRVMTQDSYDWQRAFERGDILRVGVNCFTSEQEEKPTRIYRADPKIEEQRVAAVRELKRTRNNRKVREALNEIKAMAASEPTADNNLMPTMIEAVRCYATVGEICDALREVWGEFEEPRFF